MVDIVIAAASVIAGDSAQVKDGIAGETIAAGKVVSLDPATGRAFLADNNHATVALRKAKGVALNGASNGQPVAYASAGPVTVGAVVVPGTAYYLSDTPGGICPVADVGTGERSVLLGLATSASVIDLDIQDSGVAL